MTNTQIFNNIRQWHSSKGLNEFESIDCLRMQTLKLTEEFFELKTASNFDEYKDAVGDMLVIMSSIADICGIKLEDILKDASTKECFNSEVIEDTMKELVSVVCRSKMFRIPAALSGICVRLASDFTIGDKSKEEFLLECLEIAYEEIKDRTGKLVNGCFVKEKDL